jgi:hypothetical protein
MSSEILHPCDTCIFNGYIGCSQYDSLEDCPTVQSWWETGTDTTQAALKQTEGGGDDRD